MRVYALAGQRDQALHQYRRLRDVLRREVDAEPDDTSQRLYADIRAGRFPDRAHVPHVAPERDTARRGDRRHLRSRARAPLHDRPISGNLPEPLTSFVGRGREISGVMKALAHARLVTLLGPAGIGKTRLALRVAADVGTAYPDGVWVADLSSLFDPAGVPDTVASALGVKTAPGTSATDALRRHLRLRRLLLLLDNCEHLIPACADLVTGLLGASQGLRVLATSRHALKVHGEAKWVVPSLSLPERDAVPPVDEMAHYDAIRLFVERAHLSRPGLSLTEANAAAVLGLCRRLDGLPLAIERAAARLATLSPEQIMARLPERLDLLADSGRGVPDRQQTLRSAVAWSYSLLDDTERRLFDRCAVFAGGFTLEAVEAVCAGGVAEADAIIDLLGRLVDKSMLTVDETRDGQVRYRLLETLREFGREQLDASGGAEAVSTAHARFFLILVETTPNGSPAGDHGRWLDRVEAEYENIRAALRWAIARGDAETALRFGEALGPLWSDRGPLTEGRALLADILALPGAQAPTPRRAAVLLKTGKLAWTQGAYDAARTLVEESLALAGRISDRAGVARALHALGPIARVQGDYSTAHDVSAESLAIFRELGDRPGQSNVLQNLGMLAVSQGDLDNAQECFDEKLEIDRRLGSRHGMAFALIGLAFVAWRRGHLGEARRLLEECLGLRRQVGDWIGIARTLNELGDLALARGDLDEARTRLEESLTVGRKRGVWAGVSRTLGSLGRLALKQGHLQAARASLEEQLRLAQDMGDRDDLVRALEMFALLAVAEGDFERSLRLGGAASAFAEGFHAPLLMDPHAEFERAMNTAREGLDAEAVTRAWADGQQMCMENAVAYALGGGTFLPAPSDERPPAGAPLSARAPRPPRTPRPRRDRTV